MKKTQLTLFFILASSTLLVGQKTQNTSFPDLPIDEDTKLITYREVVNQSGAPTVLFERALNWANKYFPNPLVSITKQDKKAGIVECVSNVQIKTLSKDGVTWTNAGFVYYTLRIEARENRYRYTITDIHKRESARFPVEKWLDTSRPEWVPARYDHFHQINAAVEKLIADLKKGMEPEKVKVDEW